MRLLDLKSRFPELEIITDGRFNSTGSNDSVHDKEILSYIMAKKYIKGLSGCISCVITTSELAEYVPESICVALVDKPKEAFFKIHNSLSKEYTPAEKHTIIGEGCDISPNALISGVNVVIGNNVVIEDNVVVKEGVSIGDGCVLRSGAIIGGIGLNICKIGDDAVSLNHYGSVVIQSNVEVLNNSVISKAMWKNDSTIIGSGSKLDNMVLVGHGAKTGYDCIFSACAVIGGNAIIGSNTSLGLNSTIKNHIKIGSNVRIGMGAAVMTDVPDGKTVFGNPAMSLKNERADSLAL